MVQNRLLSAFNGNEGAADGVIDQLEAESGLLLPSAYSQLLRDMNGGEGFVGPSYLILWKAEDLVSMNSAYEVNEYAPGLFVFGSDGGGEAFAFDTRDPAMPIVTVPFVGMDLSLARPMAPDFDAFLAELSRS